MKSGGMRMQETWAPAADMDFSKINKLVQANFEKIVDRSMKLGINHFETARGYGTSEVQYGEALKKYPRESYVLQTKVVPKASTDGNPNLTLVCPNPNLTQPQSKP